MGRTGRRACVQDSATTTITLCVRRIDYTSLEEEKGEERKEET